MKRIVLYYPTISVPSGAWLKQALLYWDEIASVIPRQWDEVPQSTLNPEIMYLRNEGIFKPIRPEDLIRKQSYSVVKDLEKEFLSILKAKQFKHYLGPKKHWAIDSRIHLDKISHNLQGEAVSRRLARKKIIEKDNSAWYVFERKTALLYMSLLAKYLADNNPRYVVPSTDIIQYRNFNYFTNITQPGCICANVFLRDILPMPREDVSLEDIILFKRRRYDELLKFRLFISNFERNIANARTRTEVKELVICFNERIKVEVSDLHKVLKDSNISIIIGSLSFLINLKSFTLWSSIMSYANKYIKLINIPVEINLAGLGIMGSIEISGNIIDKINERRAKLRNSPFSYLYYAKQLTKK